VLNTLNNIISQINLHLSKPIELHDVYINFKFFQISNNSNGHTNNGTLSDNDSDDEEGDYTVYECPGLAPVCFLKRRLIGYHVVSPNVVFCLT